MNDERPFLPTFIHHNNIMFESVCGWKGIDFATIVILIEWSCKVIYFSGKDKF